MTDATVLARRLSGRPIALFLDFDGTLAPIVDDPASATLPEGTRHALERLRSVCPVAILSGRDRADVRARVGLDGIAYAGGHGADIVTADGATMRALDDAQCAALASASARLAHAFGSHPGLAGRIETKSASIAVHVRGLDSVTIARLSDLVDDIRVDVGRLCRIDGHEIMELRPFGGWTKGTALRWLLARAGGDEVHPVMIGDDTTDEDAFRALLPVAGAATSIRVGAIDRPTAAAFRLASPDEVGRLLALLATERSEPGS